MTYAGSALSPELDWLLPGCVRSYNFVGDVGYTAQCHPFYFTTAMKDMALAASTVLMLGTVKSIVTYGLGREIDV